MEEIKTINQLSASKQVNIVPLNSDVYLTIYNAIKNTGKLPSSMGSKQRINRYVSILKREGYIGKLGYGVWTILKDIKEVNIVPRVYQNIRAHGFHWKVKIPKIPNWHKRADYLDNKDIKYEQKNGYQSIEIRNFTIWLCNKVLIVYTDNSYYGQLAKEGYKYALYDLEQVLCSLENMLGCSFRINKNYEFKVCKQHYGKIKDALAEQCNKNNVKIRCYYNGEGWLVIDNSFNLNELETDNPKTSRTDMDKVIIPVFNDYKGQFETTGKVILPSDITKLILDTQKQVQEIAAAQLNTNMQIQSILNMLYPLNNTPIIKDNDKDKPSYIG